MHGQEKRLDLDIIKRPEFKHANQVLDSILKQGKASGLEKAVVHKQPISDIDWELLTDYYVDVESFTDPRKLTSFVWMTVISHVCLRGREIQAQMTVDDLVFKTNEDGEEMIMLKMDFMTMDDCGGSAGSSFATSGCICDKMQISVIKRYLSQLNPGQTRLFQLANVGAGQSFS